MLIPRARRVAVGAVRPATTTTGGGGRVRLTRTDDRTATVLSNGHIRDDAAELLAK